MGIYLKNGDKNLKNKIDGFSYPQKQFMKILGEIWNNQDNLSSSDLENLEHISKKGYFDD